MDDNKKMGVAGIDKSTEEGIHIKILIDDSAVYPGDDESLAGDQKTVW